MKYILHGGVRVSIESTIGEVMGELNKRKNGRYQPVAVSKVVKINREDSDIESIKVREMNKKICGMRLRMFKEKKKNSFRYREDIADLSSFDRYEIIGKPNFFVFLSWYWHYAIDEFDDFNYLMLGLAFIMPVGVGIFFPAIGLLIFFILIFLSYHLLPKIKL